MAANGLRLGFHGLLLPKAALFPSHSHCRDEEADRTSRPRSLSVRVAVSGTRWVRVGRPVERLVGRYHAPPNWGSTRRSTRPNAHSTTKLSRLLIASWALFVGGVVSLLGSR